MKLLIKPLRGGEFTLENVSLTDTVGHIKERIETEKGDKFPADGQKLIYATKIMDNEKTLADYKVKEEGGFLVCMVSKKKKKPATSSTSAAATSQSAATMTTSAASTPAPAAATATNTAAATPAPAAAIPPSVPAAAVTTSPVVDGGAGAAATMPGVVISEDAVNHLKEMGFADTDVRAALTAAYGNAERAVEFLMNPALMQAAQAAQAQGGLAGLAGVGGAGAGAGAGNRLEQFRQHPDFDQLRRLVQNQPGSLETILQRIEGADPGLFQAISQNMEEFVQMMNEPVADETPGAAGAAPMGMDLPPGMAGMGGMPGLGGQVTPQQLQGMLQMMQQMSPEQRQQIAATMGLRPDQLDVITQAMQNMPPEQLQQMFAQGLAGMGGADGPGMQMPARIQLTPEEVAAVDRLAAMGFPRDACVEAYLICDKNEELAANYLISNPRDDEEQQQ